MSGEVEYEIVDGGGEAWPFGANKRVAIAAAKRFDVAVPHEAPHRVFRVTREQVYP